MQLASSLFYNSVLSSSFVTEIPISLICLSLICGTFYYFFFFKKFFAVWVFSLSHKFFVRFILFFLFNYILPFFLFLYFSYMPFFIFLYILLLLPFSFYSVSSILLYHQFFFFFFSFFLYSIFILPFVISYTLSCTDEIASLEVRIPIGRILGKEWFLLLSPRFGFRVINLLHTLLTRSMKYSQPSYLIHRCIGKRRMYAFPKYISSKVNATD